MDDCPILFGVDESYVEPMLVTLTSLVVDGGLSTADAPVFVLHCSLGDEAQARVSRAAAALDVDLELVRLEPSPDDYPVSDWISPAAYLRLRVAEAVPSFDRALYLDCDLVTVGDIRELLTLRPDTALAAVRALPHPLVGSGNAIPGYSELGIPGDREYFNTGVLVINLERWQAESVAARASRFLIEHPEHVRFWDQDALNVVLDDRWHRLQLEFNAVVMSPLMPALEQHYLGSDVLPLADALAIEQRARILHYAGPLKPWNRTAYPDCEVGEIYERYRRELQLIEGPTTGRADTTNRDLGDRP